jgi:F-type H+-transporting ATPase subunit a
MHEKSSAQHGAKEESFNAGEMIMEHVSDAHDWHMWGEHDHAVSIPLPVILWTDKGLDVFMSSRFHHGTEAVEGKYTYTLAEPNIVATNELGEKISVTDLSITKNAASAILTLLLMTWVFISVAKAYSRRPGLAPKGLQSFVEPMIIFVRDDVARANIGEKKYKKFMPFLLTVFFFIWISNMLGLIPIFPGGANVTGNIAVAMTLAAMVFIITIFSGNKHYWHHIFAMPGVPPWVLIILTPIEILGIFLRPFVLMIRLFANIAAGHIIALAFFSLIFIFAHKYESAGAGFGASILSVAFTVFMMALELLVAFLQAYVFTLLSAVYFGAAVEEAHGHSHDHHGSADHHGSSVPASHEQQAII